ncbi:MAG: hypothetical protein L6Q76_34915 [Polyangiaceae bacterium]|nr:hypothetical protein [Polyangiaceae bacterium]
MSAADARRHEYAVPLHRPPDDTTWYHFLYGSVPGHQIDLIARPELPHGALSRQHFSHLLRLLKNIEHREGARFAFAVGHLSRDDTQHVPGHGGIALVFALRVAGATDHTGRRDPPFAHAIAAIDRDLDAPALEATAMSFYERIIGSGEGDSEAVRFYRAYAASKAGDSDAAMVRIASYLNEFDDLPRRARSSLVQEWRAEDAARGDRVVIVHPDEAPFAVVAACAARLASILYRSNVRWTSITTGREADIENGLSIRIVPERDAKAQDARGGPVVRLGDIPRDDGDAARLLFGVTSMDRRRKGAALPEGWRERYAGGGAKEADAALGTAAEAKGGGEPGAAAVEDARGAEDALDEAPTLEMAAEELPKMNAPDSPAAAPAESRGQSRRWGYISAAGAGGLAALVLIYAIGNGGAQPRDPNASDVGGGAGAAVAANSVLPGGGNEGGPAGSSDRSGPVQAVIAAPLASPSTRERERTTVAPRIWGKPVASPSANSKREGKALVRTLANDPGSKNEPPRKGQTLE